MLQPPSTFKANTTLLRIYLEQLAWILSFENNVYLPLAVGTAQKWDDDITRIEVGMGNFINESTLAKKSHINQQITIYQII